MAESQLHMQDLENRGRRNNLYLRGLPEATKGEKIAYTVAPILQLIWSLTGYIGHWGLDHLILNDRRTLSASLHTEENDPQECVDQRTE